MAFQRLPETVQTLYSELLDQAIQAEAEASLLKAPQGSFVSKTIRGGTYWYLQRVEGDAKRQHYLGRESPSLLSWMDQVRTARSHSAEDAAQRANLSGMLAAGGAATDSAQVVKVLSLLAESGVFRMGGVLVGTQAFIAFGNMLGVRFEKQALRTQDVDVDHDRAIGIALSRENMNTRDTKDIKDLKAATGTEEFSSLLSSMSFMSFTSLLPPSGAPAPSVLFKIRGRELRVDFLTPPLEFLDYLIETPAQAVVVGGAGVLVNVPDPARFALHKLWISARRNVSEQTKALKDLRQAGDLLEVLLADRPADVARAWEALRRTKAPAATVRKAIQRLSPELREALASRLP